MAVFAAAVSLLSITWFLKRRLFLILFLIVMTACVGYVLYKDPFTQKLQSSRLGVWAATMQKGFERPITGHTNDSFRCLFPGKKYFFVRMNKEEGSPTRAMSKEQYEFFVKNGKSLTVWDNAHNEYIQLFYEFGVVGVIFCIGFLRQLWRRFRLSRKNKDCVVMWAGILSLLVMSIGQFPFHLTRTGCFIPILLGAFIAVTDKSWQNIKA